MKNIISKKILKKLVRLSANPGQGYSDIYRDWMGSTPGGSGIGRGQGLMDNIDLWPIERVTDWNKYIEKDMVEEWGQDKGVKPSGTQVILKKIIKRKNPKNKKKKKDLELIRKKERITRSNPKFLGRYQKHPRKKTYPQDKYRNNEFGGWPHQRDEPILPSLQPTSWEEWSNRFMFL